MTDTPPDNPTPGTPEPADSPDLISRDAGELYMRLLLEHEQRIYSFILSLVHNWADADDLMQETCAVMWRKFDGFEPGTNFSAWAMQIAYFQVLNHRKIKRKARARISDANVEALADKFRKVSDQREARRDALHTCIGKLPQRDQRLVQLRYLPDATTRDVADAVGKSIDAVYKALNKAHRTLRECVHETLAAEGHA